MNLKSIAISMLLLASTVSCKPPEKNYDATGSFEAEETIISSEATGTLLQFNVEEGQQLKAGEIVGYVDSLQLYLRKNNWKRKSGLCWVSDQMSPCN